MSELSRFQSLPGKPNVPGLLVAIEGIDLSGKTSLTIDLRDQIVARGGKAEVIAFPYRSTTIGAALDAYLKGTSEILPDVAHLLFSANRREIAPRIRSLMNEGVHVILDRYHYSGAAYSMANGLERTWCEQVDAGLPKVDILIYLDVSPCDVRSLVSERLTKTAERYERHDFLEKVAQSYAQIFSREMLMDPHHVCVSLDPFKSRESIQTETFAIFKRVYHQFWLSVNVPELGFVNPRDPITGDGNDVGIDVPGELDNQGVSDGDDQ
jgi:dTMP kinase